MKKILYISFCFLLSAISMNAQVFTANLEAGEAAFERGDYYKAMSYFEEALAYEQEDYDLWFKYAESARHFDAYAKADEAYEQLAEQKDHSDYMNALYNRALVKKLRGEYDNSIALFEAYLNSENNDSLSSIQAREHLEENRWALTQVEENNQTYEIELLSEKVNSSYSEFSPYKSSGQLYFTSSRESEKSIEGQDVQKILMQSDDEQSFILAGETDLLDMHTGHFTLSIDKEQAYFTICQQNANYELRCEIYSLDKNTDGQWANATKLPQNINANNSTNTQPNIGLDKDGNEALYFVSDREGGLGNLDLWYSPIKNGKYAGPYNLSAINTPEDEISPFFDIQSSALYFSTDGLLTLGGLDVYVSKLKDDDWAVAEHLGLPVNSSYNDAFFSISDEENEAYFSSNRLASRYIDDLKEACCYDIYSAKKNINILDLLASTFDIESRDPLEGVKLELRKKEDSNPDKYYEADAVHYKLEVEEGETYEIVATKEGYETERLELFISEKEADTKIYLKEELPAIVTLSNEVFNGSNEPLYSISYCVTNLRTDSTFCKDDLSDNTYSLDLNPRDEYLIVTKRAGYRDDEETITGKDLVAKANSENKITLKKVVLPPVTKLTLDAYLPMPLYFDNDQPDIKTLSKTTLKTYAQTNEAYYARKGIFIDQYTNGLDAEAKVQSSYELENFFEQKVKEGNNTLSDFTAHLLRYLQAGNKASIVLKGYASPRAKSTYNDNLTFRRVSSMRNHFNQWNNGALIPFLNNGLLQVVEKAFGENNANQGVSDDVQDVKNSIYSVEASLERRVEILEIKTN